MATTANTYHVPVLLHESVDGLAIAPGGVYVDVTFGGGGHSREILSRLSGGGRLYSFDQDADAEKNIGPHPGPPQGEGAYEVKSPTMALPDGRISVEKENKENTEGCINPSSPHGGTEGGRSRFVFVRSNFRYLSNWMRYHGEDHIDGLLADLGVSSHHLDDESRGFSFRFDAPLDMRMNRRAGLTAADVVNGYDEQRLADIIYLYGELRQARRLASVIVAARSQRRIETTADLLAATEPLMRRDREKKDTARLFQALRIEVNHEMDALREMLAAATRLLAPGGRLSVITYHSLEDRIVKNFIKTGNAEGRLTQDFFGRTQAPLKAVNTKVIVPSDEEQERNPRSRSAKLRVAEKI
ncbi:MAG: 16S rRNA (cytosine(1402)-N(4))-methyltransferase RsmH [Prevotella sp.]|nr:16S rRNA (cytosine(1402)-N(4))-methyltransferase RsmH [Prevotella sp.]